MAGNMLEVTTPQITFSTSTVTLAQILAGANVRLKVVGVTVTFQGISNTGVPINVQIVRQTTAGTTTGSATVVKKESAFAETPLCTGTYLATAEPTTTDVLESEAVHPQAGVFWDLKDRPIPVPGGGRLGVRLVSPAAGSTCYVKIDVEE
jgi:hypothetical protein